MKYILAITCLVVAFPTSAAVCQIRSGSVEVGGKRLSIEGASDQCPSKVKIASSQAEICLFNSLKQWNCKTFDKGEDVNLSDFYIDDEYQKSFVEVFLSLWKPEVEKNYGGKRLKDSEYLAGFPYGEILLPEDALVFDTSKSIESQIDSFYLLEAGQEGALIFGTESPVDVVSIPASQLSAGGRYRWQMRSGGQEYVGNFSVAISEDQQNFEADLRNAQSSAELTGVAGAVLRAVVAKEWGYTFDSQRALDAARESVKLN